MHLLPEFRKASKSAKNEVSFGTVDCTIHQQLCQQYNIKSFPTTIMYNQSVQHYFNGQHQEQAILNFIDDILHPTVIVLDNDLYVNLVENKNLDEMWLVDFFMPWCFPCQELSGEWRKLSKVKPRKKNIHLVSILFTLVFKRYCPCCTSRLYSSISLMSETRCL